MSKNTNPHYTQFLAQTDPFRAIHGRSEVLEGSAAEDIVILDFSTYEDAKAWYHGSAYQVASKHRHQGGDYRFILTKGISAH